MRTQDRLTMNERQWIELGEQEYNLFKDDVIEAMTNNRFNDHFIFQSLPGTGKTETAKRTAEAAGISLLKFEGSQGLFAFCADVAYALLHAPDDGSMIYCIFDDCDSLFQSGDTLNTIKGLFDAGRKALSYRRQLGGQYYMLDEAQRDAIDAFKEEGRSGFSIPVDRFVFITLTNKHFPSQDEVQKASDSKKDYYSGLAAIRRRVQYKKMDLDRGADWGYCAHILLTSDLVERYYPDITEEQKLEMLRFTSPINHWDTLIERNLSLFEKMAKDIVRFPDTYYDRWVSQYKTI